MEFLFQIYESRPYYEKTVRDFFMNHFPIIMVHDFLQCHYGGTYHIIIVILEMEMRSN